MAQRSRKTTKRGATNPPTSLTLNAWLTTIKKNAAAAAAAGEETGACLISDPHTGTNQCIITDKNTCKSLKGVFLGGPCGG